MMIRNASSIVESGMNDFEDNIERIRNAIANKTRESDHFFCWPSSGSPHQVNIISLKQHSASARIVSSKGLESQ